MPTDDLKRVQAALAIGNRELDKYFAASGRNGLVEWFFWRRGESGASPSALLRSTGARFLESSGT